MRVGIIDLGTNSVRLFVYDVRPSRPPRKIYQTKSMVRLGDNFYQGSLLDPLAIKRTVKAIKGFKRTLSEFRVTTLRAVGTSALRSASNGGQLIDSVKKATGIVLEPISGSEEARLIALGVLSNEPCGTGRHLLVDIGGGSTEMIVVQDNAPIASFSLELGAARCQQEYLKTVPPKITRETKLRAQVQTLIAEAFPEELLTGGFDSIIGSSGSIRAMTRLVHSKNEKTGEFLKRDLQRLCAELRPLKKQELLTIPLLEPKRVDLILSAVVILDEICNFLRIPLIRTTQFALKDGLVYEVIQALQKDSSQEALGTAQEAHRSGKQACA